MLQLEQLDITLAIDFLERSKHFLGSEVKDAKAVDQHHLFLLESKDLSKLEEFHNKVQQGKLTRIKTAILSYNRENNAT